MRAVILRSKEPLQTRGTFLVYEGTDILLSLKSLELPDKNNAKRISCILAGIYWVDKIQRPNGDLAFLLNDVPGRTAILIHIANFASGLKVDLEGCIAPGMSFTDINKDGNLDVTGSSLAMELLLRVLPKRFQLTIVDN